MAEETRAASQRTLLYDWHLANGGKMVPFGGWEMPVQYQGGIIQEHLSTRCHAGLFDVSHMGRYEVRGPGAEAALVGLLTNNARALEPGEAHYTFIATESGGAVDDAYLYRLGAERFLLVVNAGNRGKDWDWLVGHGLAEAAELQDVSEDLAMFALQGPHAAAILEQLVGPRALPENRRNLLSEAEFQGAPLTIARSGYTGEAVCFELLVPAATALAFWEALVELSAVPVGLGARDSLRLEAGLPLYGHELGADAEGNEIPIFANALANFAVRPAGGEDDYIGREALEAQRAEFVRIKRGELASAPEQRLLSHMIQPIAAFEGRRPLRAGYRLRHEGEEVGRITSGTTVPYPRFEGAGLTAVPSAEEYFLRPIALALLRSDLRYRSDRPVVLEVVDERGRALAAELVERNLWPAAPYTRPYTGFVEPPDFERTDKQAVAARARALSDEAEANTRWRRRECINLIPSEQTPSRYVERLSTADPAGRYNEHNRLRALGPDAPDVRYYKGTGFIMEKEEELKAALRSFFDCTRAEARVISGQMANDTVFDALKQFRNRFRRLPMPARLSRVLVHDLNKGGHLSAQPTGALKNYVAHDPETARPAVSNFPIVPDNPHLIDIEATKALIERVRPELIVFGRSVIIHKEPVKEIADFVFELWGRDNPERPLIMYDGAHVLGLLGPYFQQPLAEGADVVTGSTHKTFFGPQRGVILSNIVHGSPFEGFWDHVQTRAFPGHVSNHHLGTLLGLLGATYEMIEYRDEYPRKVIANAKAFARALHDHGLTLEGDAQLGYTETHQVLLRTARAKGEKEASLLEANNVITNPQAFHDDSSFAAASGVRMGTQEMTRYGMDEADFAELAALLTEILAEGDRRPAGHWKDKITAFRDRFTEMRYCF